MRTMFLVILCGLAVVLGFAQDTDPMDIPEADPPITVDETPNKPPPEPSAFIKYFQWAGENAIRKDFILSTLFFVWDTDKQGIGEEMFTIHWSFLPFTSIGIGLGLSGLFDEIAFPQFAGFTVQGGFVIPATKKIKIFGDMLLEMGYGTINILPDTGFALNYGYDLGFALLLDRDFGIEIKYKGIWTSENRYLNALGFGWLWNFWGDDIPRSRR